MSMRHDGRSEVPGIESPLSFASFSSKWAQPYSDGCADNDSYSDPVRMMVNYEGHSNHGCPYIPVPPFWERGTLLVDFRSQRSASKVRERRALTSRRAMMG